MIQFTLTIEDTQIINGVEYTQDEILQAIARIRSQHNERTGEALDDAAFINWANLQNFSAWHNQTKGSEAVEPSPIAPVADWNALKNRLLGGDLYPIFQRLTFAALNENANTISTARGDITDAILTVKIEAALANGLGLLVNIGNYAFTDDEKLLWNNAIAELNFTDLVKI
jgi:hypothetical protein